MTRTAEAARGKWRGILLQVGAASKCLDGKHGPCPFCGGRDRFRFDNLDGRGTFICAQCGSGDGFEFLRRLKGWEFPEAAAEIDKIVGNVSAEPPRKRIDERDRRRMLNQLWSSGVPICTGDLAASYLLRRGLALPQNTACLRYVERCPVPVSIAKGRRELPAMVAMVMSPDGKPATLHRTFLGPNGKADLEDCRATMPGEIPDGSAVRLSMHGARLGIAEGIETALAATARFGLPVWAALNATMLSKWTPPQGVSEVVVFGDNDPKFAGAAAAYALAKRLSAANLIVEVKIPQQIGLDWADEQAA